jgi:hypothetical protein
MAIFFSFVLKFLWNLIGILQFLSFMPSWKLDYPLNAIYLLKYIRYVAFMEFIPTEEI